MNLNPILHHIWGFGYNYWTGEIELRRQCAKGRGGYTCHGKKHEHLTRKVQG